MKSSLKFPLKNRSILLGLSGSIALYKSCDLVRRIQDEGGKVFCVMTRSAREFISPMTFSALSENPVGFDCWDERLGGMSHLSLAAECDLYIIAPASANCLARLAIGMADDAVTAAAISTKSPILIAPAMHENMWLHPATQENVKRLKGYGYHFVGPERGALSKRVRGWGRLADIPAILSAAKKVLFKQK